MSLWIARASIVPAVASIPLSVIEPRAFVALAMLAIGGCLVSLIVATWEK